MRNLKHSVISVVLLGFLSLALAQESVDVELSIAEQPLSASLREVADSFELTIAFYSESTDGLEGPALEGEYTSEAAFDSLLADTDLEYTFISDSSVAVRPIAAVAGQGGVSDSKNSRPAPVLMVQNTMSETQTTVSSHSDDEAKAQQDQSSIPLEEIIVIGTNIRGVENPTVPVLTFDREDISQSGAITVEDFLRTIPQNFSQTSPIGLDSANDFNDASNFSNGTAIDLRGLGAGNTLTLLNGRRMTATGSGSYVDISLLPLDAVERVDVLTDGASAIYGADAVAGVVNFVTRNDFDGIELTGRYGTVTDGSREEYSLAASAGHSWVAGGALFGVDYVDQRPLLSTERDFFDPDLINPNGTVGADSERFGAFASFNQGLTDKLTFAVDAFYSSRESSSFINFQQQVELASDQEAYFINSRLSYDVTEDVTATIFFDSSREDGSQVNSAQPDNIDFIDNTLHVVEAQISGGLFHLPSGAPLSFALGAAYRDEKSELSDSNDPSVLSLSRENIAAYGELLIPIVGSENALPALKVFDLSIAARYEDYSDFDDTFNPKIGLHLIPHDDLILRASYSTAFRAPTLSTIARPEGVFIVNFPNSFFTAFPAPGENGTTSVINFPAGNPEIGPEQADVWSAGFEFTPGSLPGFTLSTTYFSIAYEDRIEDATVLDLLQNPAYSDLVDLNPDPTFVADTFERALSGGFDGITIVDPTISPEDVQVIFNAGTQNIAVRDIEGLDIGLAYSFDTDSGSFSASLNSTYLLSNDSRITDLSDPVDDLNVLYRPIDLKLRGGLVWSNGGLSVSGYVNHTGGYVDSVDRTIANDIDSWTTVDLAFSYDTLNRFDSVLLDGTRLSVNFRNVFDEDPPFVSTLDGFNYDTSNADPFGRFITLSFSKTF